MIALARVDNIVPMPQKATHSILLSSKSNEWYTPSIYVEAAREVMGSIDLDPASSEFANRTIKATKFYTQRENGLQQPWFGNVWLNPPFNKVNGKSSIGKWSRKLVRCYQSGTINQAILLGAGQTASAWFIDIWDFPICFVNHHIRFYCPQLDKTAGQRDCTFMAYLGTNEQRFIDIFSQFGTVVRRVSKPKARPVNLSLWEGM